MLTRRAVFVALAAELVASASCSSPQPSVAAPAPVGTSAQGTHLAKPSADHRLGHFSTIENLSALASATVLTCSSFAALSAVAPPCRDPRLWTDASAIDAADPTVDAWQYSPWFDETLSVDGTTWRAQVFLGGLGILTDASGNRGAFLVHLGTGRAGDASPL